MVESSTCESETMEVASGLTKQVYQHDWGPEKKRKLPSVDTGTFREPNVERLLICEIATLRKEMDAMRQFMDWQSRRIVELERKLNVI